MEKGMQGKVTVRNAFTRLKLSSDPHMDVVTCICPPIIIINEMQ